MSMLFRTLVVVALALFAEEASAKELYVSTGGSDSADGSKGAPWKTIRKAAGAAVAGDTVHVAPGEYDETFTSSADGTAAAPIVFLSDTLWGAKIVGPPHVTGGPVAVWNALGDHVDIVGFDITGGPRVGILVQGSYVRTIRNHVHDMKADWGGSAGGGGIVDGDYAAHDDDMIGNVVHDIGPTTPNNGVHGLYHSNLRGRIVNNIAYRNAGWGIHTWHNPKDVLIANNLVFENRQGGIIVGAGDSPGTGYADGFLVTNNIVVKNYGHAGIIEYGAYGPGNLFMNNLVWGNPVGAYTVMPMSKVSGSIALDPKFVKYDAVGNSGDYHLLEGSPAIDHGASKMAPDDDIEGTKRPQGAGFDIGPYEWFAPTADAGTSDAITPEASTDASDETASDASVEDTATGSGLDPEDASAETSDGAPALAATDDAAGCSCSSHARSRLPAFGASLVLAAIASMRRRRR
jgi:hypothetical protein